MLGSFQDVSSKTLLQTISKEVLYGAEKGKLKVGRTAPPDLSNQQVAAGDIFISDDNDLESNAVGVFVNGLEDEFEEVRNATVDSICELSLTSLAFAKASVDFLVDMLNDEIDEVRINAITSLHKLGKRVQLQELQVKKKKFLFISLTKKKISAAKIIYFFFGFCYSYISFCLHLKIIIRLFVFRFTTSCGILHF